jgi:polyphosphate glucokinase
MTQPNSESVIRFGVDIGGTGIKGAPVDLSTGLLTADRLRIPTPQPATPAAVGAVVAQVVSHFGWTGPIGTAFPAAVKNGIAMTAANVDKSWIGADIEASLAAATGTEVRAINDADAAGVAELAYGAGKGHDGVVIVTTFGTGIGTALFLHGQLVPNTELGHIEIDGKDAEKEASELVRERKGLSWAKWAKRVDRYLTTLEALFWPDLIIIGGGASRKADKFIPLLTLRTPVVPAALQNDAGIVGAAIVGVGDVTRPASHQDAPAPAPAKKAAARKRAPAKTAAKTAVPAKRVTKAATKSAATAAPTAAAKKTATKRAPRKSTGA